MKKILHLIPSLDKGGAENVLKRYLLSNNCKGQHHIILLKASLRDASFLTEKGIKIDAPNPSTTKLSYLRNLIKRTKEINPDIIQGWMYHACLIALLLSWFSPKKARVYWNIRRQYDNSINTKFLTRFLAKFLSYLSGKASRVIYPSPEALLSHVQRGYAKTNAVVIENGYDETIFRPNITQNKILKKDLQIPSDVLIVGYVARFHPIKGYDVFLKAASSILKDMENVYFLMIGKGFNLENKELTNLVKLYKLNRRIVFLEETDAIHKYYPLMDVFVSTSYCEGFCNTIAEAMLAGTPTIATHVGNAKTLLGKHGILLNTHNTEDLKKSVLRILKMDTEEYKIQSQGSRDWIIERFSIKKMIDSYNTLYFLD